MGKHRVRLYFVITNLTIHLDIFDRLADSLCVLLLLWGHSDYYLLVSVLIGVDRRLLELLLALALYLGSLTLQAQICSI